MKKRGYIREVKGIFRMMGMDGRSRVDNCTSCIESTSPDEGKLINSLQDCFLNYVKSKKYLMHLNVSKSKLQGISNKSR